MDPRGWDEGAQAREQFRTSMILVSHSPETLRRGGRLADLRAGRLTEAGGLG